MADSKKQEPRWPRFLLVDLAFKPATNQLPVVPGSEPWKHQWSMEALTLTPYFLNSCEESSTSMLWHNIRYSRLICADKRPSAEVMEAWHLCTCIVVARCSSRMKSWLVEQTCPPHAPVCFCHSLEKQGAGSTKSSSNKELMVSSNLIWNS